jgi:hypothetical protein
MIMEGSVMEGRPVNAGIPPGLLVSPIVFATYTSGLMKWVEVRVSGIEGLSFVDDVGWISAGRDMTQVVRKLESCSRESID